MSWNRPHSLGVIEKYVNIKPNIPSFSERWKWNFPRIN